MKILLLAVGLAAALAGGLRAAETEYVFLVTGDGIRHQELFTGADPELMKPENEEHSGIQDYGRIREMFWDEDPAKRREKTMPFFWRELAPRGIVLGNRALGSEVNLKNPHHFSYPGYAEILNGQHVPEVTSNDGIFSPRQTVLEYLRREFGLGPEGAAVFGSWKIFNWIAMHEEGAVFCNAGYERMPERLLTPQARLFDQLQFDMLSPWDSVRHDVPTLELALEFIRAREPKVLYLALGETDDWAHNRRYDRVLETLKYFDDALRKLWGTLQSHPRYRGKSTLIITTDHGRGRGLDDWTSHGSDVPGAEEAWIAVIGPDTPDRGELKNTPAYSLSNIAATLLKFYGLDADDYNPAAAGPIAEAFK